MKKKHGSSVTTNADTARADKARAGKTDWAQLRALSDAQVTFTEDAPATTPADWADALAHRGLPLPARKEQIALRVDADVLAWYRAQGAGWQTRMNAVLRAFKDAAAQPLPHAV